MIVHHRRFIVLFASVLAACMPASANLFINLVPGSNLLAQPDAYAAFQNAAGVWDQIFSDPITVTINADLSTNFPSNNIIGSTSAVMLTAGYAAIEGAMAAESTGQPAKAIMASLPTASQLSVQLPSGFSLTGNIAATKADLKALGFTGLDTQFGASDATMTFNSNFNFYYGTGTFQSNQIDFESVAIHEIGHALGFMSAVDTIDEDLHASTPGAIDLMPLDLYRFASTDLPTDASSFTNNTRDLLTGGTSVFSDTQVNYLLSTGAFTGDGNQASHWKDDDITGQYIGIMDPTLAYHTTAPVTSADIRALELIGFDVAAPEPVTFAPVAGALLIGICLARRKDKLKHGAGTTRAA